MPHPKDYLGPPSNSRSDVNFMPPPTQDALYHRKRGIGMADESGFMPGSFDKPKMSNVKDAAKISAQSLDLKDICALRKLILDNTYVAKQLDPRKDSPRIVVHLGRGKGTIVATVATPNFSSSESVLNYWPERRGGEADSYVGALQSLLALTQSWARDALAKNNALITPECYMDTSASRVPERTMNRHGDRYDGRQA